MGRFRLRFLLQEFDLPRGATVIGRSLDCNLTIEDPLVSRQHARIVIDDDGSVTVDDLGSRNGVRVNGVQVKGPTPLHDGDRVRIGTQDFVFCKVDQGGKGHAKTTGVLRLCSKCHLPYPRESVSCPNCESTEQKEETLSGSFGAENQSAWSVQLLVEALDRALSLGRVADAERIVRRATTLVEELMASGETVDSMGLAGLAIQAAATTTASNDPTWVLWVLDTYRKADCVPPVEVVDRVGEAAADHAGVVRGALASLVGDLRGSSRRVHKADGDIEALARLERIQHLFAAEASSSTDATGEYIPPL